jgi:hypothetical protein
VQYGAGLFESAEWQQQLESVRTWPCEAYCALLVYVCAFLMWKKEPILDVLIVVGGAPLFPKF